MKARVVKAIDLKEPERELYCIMISQGRGKKSLPAAIGGKPFFTGDRALAKEHVNIFNEKENPGRQA